MSHQIRSNATWYMVLRPFSLALLIPAALAELPLAPEEWGSPPAFGHDMLAEFSFDPSFTNLNHGSYGATPRKVLDAQAELRSLCEYNPELWFRNNVTGKGEESLYRRLEQRSRDAVASYLGVKGTDLVFVENASHGISAVLRSVAAAMREKFARPLVLYMDLNYGEVKTAVKFLEQEAAGGKHPVHMVNTLDLGWPDVSASKIVAAVRSALELPSVRSSVGLCVFDHIVSVPAVVIPIAELSQLCHQAGGLVLVDGAHAPGQIDNLSLPATGANFYVGNGHKWLYSAKGVGMLWVRPDSQDLVNALVIETPPGGQTGIQKKFVYQGTADYTGYGALLAALQFRSWIGDTAIKAHNRGLAVQGCQYLAKRWNTRHLPLDMMAPFMCNVQLPCPSSEEGDGQYGLCPSDIAHELYRKHNFYIPAYYLHGTNTTYMRISCQIYNDMEDLRMVASAVEDQIKSIKEAGMNTIERRSSGALH